MNETGSVQKSKFWKQLKSFKKPFLCFFFESVLRTLSADCVEPFSLDELTAFCEESSRTTTNFYSTVTTHF
jgi:hypothetical protein